MAHPSVVYAQPAPSSATTAPTPPPPPPAPPAGVPAGKKGGAGASFVQGSGVSAIGAPFAAGLSGPGNLGGKSSVLGS